MMEAGSALKRSRRAMKKLTKRTPRAAKSARLGDGGATAPHVSIRDGTGAWSAGLWNEAHAALVGRIAGLMPQVDELMGDLTARLLGDGALPGPTIFRGLAGEDERMTVLRALAARRSGSARGNLDDAIAGYGAARRRWRAYLRGLWYTHENGRTFLAAPGGDAATFLVAREVRAAELEAQLARLSELGATLPRLVPPQAALATPASTPRGASQSREPEAAKPRRPAPKREAGKRAPVRSTG
jgi:hypothetical protein